MVDLAVATLALALDLIHGSSRNQSTP